MNELTNYQPMLLALVLALTLVTNIIVQVLKSMLYDMLPTNLLAFLVAAVVTVGAGFGLWSYYRFAITGWMIVAPVSYTHLDVYKRQPLTSWPRCRPPRGPSAPPGPGPIPRHRSPPPRVPATWWSGRTPPARSSSPSPWRRRCASREG